MNESLLVYVPEMARLFGRTEAAIRQAAARGADWLPPRLPMDRKLAWSRESVTDKLRELKQAAKATKPRTRKAP